MKAPASAENAWKFDPTMPPAPLHPWNVNPQEAVAIQKRLAGKIKTRRHSKPPQIVAGTDLSFLPDSRAVAGIVLLEFATLAPIGEFFLEAEVAFPYVPGLLSFREAPLLLELMRKVDPRPDLIMVDGQGIAHPRGLGLASHLGLLLDIPTIGCAKSRLTGTFREPGIKKGSHSALLDADGKTIGCALRTREACNPVFVSVGHLTELDQAVEWVLHCAPRYRIPEPTRRAHLRVTENKIRSTPES